MKDRNDLKITTRDRLLRAWLNSTELVRDYQTYANETSDSKEYKALFSEFAETEAMHASRLLDALHEEESN